jgi:acetyl esterase/lipase
MSTWLVRLIDRPGRGGVVGIGSRRPMDLRFPSSIVMPVLCIKLTTMSSGVTGIPTEAWGLPALRPSTFPTPADLTARRDGMAALPAADPVPGVETVDLVVGGVPCVVCEPPSPRASLVYFHGGGYRLGSAAFSTPFGARLAAAASARVTVVDYRLAPEHPFPAALHDAAAVHAALLEDGGPAPIAVGDSAGGGLAAALAVAATRAGLPGPRGLVLMSPWLDLTCTAGSYASRAATDELFSLDSAQQAADLYLQGHDPRDPLASPLLAELASFPPTLLMASSDEVLVEDGAVLASGLALAGVPVLASFEKGQPHAWPAVFLGTPASAAALEAIARFVDGLCDQGED